jgi:hypothetical protein
MNTQSRESKNVALIGALIGLIGAIVGALIVAGKLPPPTHDPSGTIESPTQGSRIAREFTVSGTLSHIPKDEHVWIAVQVGNNLYPKEPEIDSSSDHFSEQIVEGGNPSGGRLAVVLLKVEPEGQSKVEDWLSALRRGEEPPGLATIPGAQVLDAVASIRLEG